MASKPSKRATSTPAAPTVKKAKASPKKATQVSPKKAVKKVAEASPKIESVFSGIIAAIQNADHLPESCREMLGAMVAPSLSTPKTDRHAAQLLGVSMIEEALHDIKAKQMLAIKQAQQELSQIEECKASRVSAVGEAQGDFALKQTTEKEKQTARDLAETLVREAEAALANATELERKGEEPLAKLKTEKVTYEQISQEHVKTPMGADEALHFTEIEPYIQALGLDESLAIALPSSCTKTKDQRGGFDDVVLGELVKALDRKIELLTLSITEEAPRVAERKAAVVSATSALEEKNLVAKTAVLELEGAEAARQESSAVLSKASEELDALAPSIQTATSKLEELKAVLDSFETGPLATFQSYQNKAAPIEEAATAGA